MSLSAYVKEEDAKNRRNQMPFLDRAKQVYKNCCDAPES